jgi:monoamine oxidase
MADHDVIVVGAGAAGLAATRTLLERGLSVVALEARNRIGGRAWTDHETFGVPFDRGCAWLHAAEVNPWRDIAAEFGFTVIEKDPAWQGRVGSRRLGEGEDADWDRAIEAKFAAIAAAGKAGRDVPASTVIDPDEPWSTLFEAIVTWYASTEIDQLSTRDVGNGLNGEHDWPIVEGYGALVARYGSGLPVSLATPATRIARVGGGVAVETPDGAVRGRAAIVAVSTAVLANGSIAFDPPLPVAKQEAIHNLPLGCADKIALQIDGNPFGMAPMSHATGRSDTVRTGNYQFFPFGQPLVIGYVGGSFARELESAGEGAMAAFAVDELVDIFGGDVRRRVVKSAVTTWGCDPYIGGGYSAARPGHAHRRLDLAAPVNGTLYFAGEACSIDNFATCHGAYLTGVAAAHAAADALRRRP